MVQHLDQNVRYIDHEGSQHSHSGSHPTHLARSATGILSKDSMEKGILTDKGGFTETVAAAAITEKGKEAGIGEPDSNEYSLSIRA